MAYSAYDRLLMGSPLRRRGVGKVTVAVLLLLLGFAALTQLSLFAGMRPDVESVFLRALVLSTLLSLVPIAVLRFLDRRERESPWLMAGDRYRVPAREGLVVIARDGGVLAYEIDGKERGLLGTPGEILVGRPLDIATLEKKS